MNQSFVLYPLDTDMKRKSGLELAGYQAHPLVVDKSLVD